MVRPRSRRASQGRHCRLRDVLDRWQRRLERLRHHGVNPRQNARDLVHTRREDSHGDRQHLAHQRQGDGALVRPDEREIFVGGGANPEIARCPFHYATQEQRGRPALGARTQRAMTAPTELPTLPSMTPGATHCRFCETRLELTMVDLGKSPLCESFLPPDRLEAMEPFYPLHVRVCEKCWLAQLPSFVPPDEIFTEYACFSAYSDSWVAHARRYVDMITDRLQLSRDSL